MKSAIFAGWEVEATIAGRKTAFTRPLKVQPPSENYTLTTCMDTTGDRRIVGKHQWMVLDALSNVVDGDQPYFSMPYQPGDEVFVKETCKQAEYYTNYCGGESHTLVHYKADDAWYEYDSISEKLTQADWVKGRLAEGKTLPYYERKWKLSPQWASRLLLVVTGVKVHRIRDITIGDAIANGCCLSTDEDEPEDFKNRWDKTYAKRGLGWESNCWVVTSAFEVKEIRR